MHLNDSYTIRKILDNSIVYNKDYKVERKGRNVHRKQFHAAFIGG